MKKETACRLLAAACWLLYFLLPAGAHAVTWNDKTKDSLLLLTKTASHDSLKIRAWITLGEHFYETSPEKSIGYWEKAVKLAEKKGKSKKENRTLAILKAEALNNIALVKNYQGNNMVSIDLNFKSLAIREQNNDIHGIAESMNNLANVYLEQGDTTAGLDFLEKSNLYYGRINDAGGVAYTCINISKVYASQRKDSLALDYLFRAIDIMHKKRPDLKAGLASAFNAIGNIYKRQKKTKLARQYLMRALETRLAAGDVAGIINTHASLAAFYHENHQPDSALYYARKATENPNLHFLDARADVALINSKIYQEAGKFKEALKNYQLYILLRDSLSNDMTKKAMIRNQFKYTYTNKITTDSLKHAESIKLGKLELEKAETRQYALYAILFIILVFSLFLYSRFRLIRKQRNIIQEQKNQVEEQRDIIAGKQEEIIASINYAKGIQRAILAKEEEIRKYFPESFLLYKPKDIVAGDFYFFEVTDSHVFYAAADCTGHGVPGALVSVVCANALARCVKEFGLTEPGKILDRTRELVIETFEKSGQEVKDGMDISLISLKRDRLEVEGSKGAGESNTQTFKPPNVELQWAGANNPLWIVSPGVKEFTEIKGDKQPIGWGGAQKPFTTHTLSLRPASSLFLFTDGYADQFGGVNGKKLKTANFQKLLLQISHLSMPEQYSRVETIFNQWKGEYEQLDDICVIGLRL